MANKRNREVWAKEEKERRFLKAQKGLWIYSAVSLAIVFVVLCLFLIRWAGVYNSSERGYESPKFTGVQLLAGAFSGDYETLTEENGIGLYYHFQQERTIAMGVFGVIALLSVVASAVFSIIALVGKNHVFNFAAAVFGAVAFASFTVCYVVSLNAGYPLMVGYKCNLKVCAHRSYIIIPALFALLSIVPSVTGGVKYLKAREILK